MEYRIDYHLLPELPHFIKKPPEELNSWMRLIESIRNIDIAQPIHSYPLRMLELAIVTARLPHLAKKTPEELNFWMRLFRRSATYTLPPISTATPHGSANWPSPKPPIPHLVKKYA